MKKSILLPILISISASFTAQAYDSVGQSADEVCTSLGGTYKTLLRSDMSHIHVFNSSIMDDGAVEKGLFDSDDSPEIAAILTMRTSDGAYFLNIKDRDVFGIVKSTLRADSADDDPIYACYTQDDAELISFGVDTLK